MRKTERFFATVRAVLGQRRKVCLFHFAFAMIVLTSAANSVWASGDDAAILYKTAKSCVGKEMWKPGYGLSKGTLGCAAAVCNVLKEAGLDDAHTAVVTTMRTQLLSKPGACKEFVIRNGSAQSLDDAVLLRIAKPGDVLVAFKYPPNRPNGGGNAHCGIMGNGTVFTNNWLDGIWTEVNIHLMFDSYPYVRVLRFEGSNSSTAKLDR